MLERSTSLTCRVIAVNKRLQAWTTPINRQTMVLVVMLVVTLLGSVGLFHYEREVEQEHYSITLQLLQLQQHTAEVHLWLEEWLYGDEVEIEKIQLQVDRVERVAEQLQRLQLGAEWSLQMDRVERVVERFLAIMAMRMDPVQAQEGAVVAGSPLDDALDLHFEVLDRRVKKALQLYQQIYQQKQQIGLAVLWAGLLLLTLVWLLAIHWLRRSSSRLLANKARLLEAQRLAQIGNWELDVSTMSAHWSESIHQLMGTTAAEEVGLSLLKGFVEEEDWPALE